MADGGEAGSEPDRSRGERPTEGDTAAPTRGPGSARARRCMDEWASGAPTWGASVARRVPRRPLPAPEGNGASTAGKPDRPDQESAAGMPADTELPAPRSGAPDGTLTFPDLP